jgi:hypothetical protein
MSLAEEKIILYVHNLVLLAKRKKEAVTNSTVPFAVSIKHLFYIPS